MSSDQELRDLLEGEEYDFRYDCGIGQPTASIQLRNQDQIVSSIAMNYSVMRCMAELMQMQDGLKALGVLYLLQANHQLTRQLLVHSPSECLTADKLYDMLTAKLSPVGANQCQCEEDAYMHWVDLMQLMEGN